MSNKAHEHNPNERKELNLDKLVHDALRAEGKIFPQTDDEVARFCEQTEPPPLAESVVDRVVDAALGRAPLATGDGHLSTSVPAQPVLPAPSGSSQELVALHRGEGELSDEVRRKLEEYRRQASDEADEPGEAGDRDT